MESLTCHECHAAKPTFHCQGCQLPICKKCAQFADAADFELQMEMPADLKAGAYCNHCHRDLVQPALEIYNELAALADQVSIFEISQGKETRFVRRQERPIQVVDCADRSEAEMRLAYLAARAGFNALVDVDVRSAKFKTGGSYQKLKWQGSGVPVQIDPGKLKVRK